MRFVVSFADDLLITLLAGLLSDGPMANSTCESLASFFHHHVYGRTPSLQSNDPYLPPQGAATSSESNSSATSSIGGLSVAVTAISRVPQHSRLLQQNQFGRQALYQRAEAARPPAKKSSGGWTKKKMHAIWKFIVERH